MFSSMCVFRTIQKECRGRRCGGRGGGECEDDGSRMIKRDKEEIGRRRCGWAGNSIWGMGVSLAKRPLRVRVRASSSARRSTLALTRSVSASTTTSSSSSRRLQQPLSPHHGQAVALPPRLRSYPPRRRLRPGCSRQLHREHYRPVRRLRSLRSVCPPLHSVSAVCSLSSQLVLI